MSKIINKNIISRIIRNYRIQELRNFMINNDILIPKIGTGRNGRVLKSDLAKEIIFSGKANMLDSKLGVVIKPEKTIRISDKISALEKLPKEILMKVLSGLDLEYVKNVCMVSKKIGEFCDDDFWETYAKSVGMSSKIIPTKNWSYNIWIHQHIRRGPKEKAKYFYASIDNKFTARDLDYKLNLDIIYNKYSEKGPNISIFKNIKVGDLISVYPGNKTLSTLKQSRAFREEIYSVAIDFLVGETYVVIPNLQLDGKLTTKKIGEYDITYDSRDIYIYYKKGALIIPETVTRYLENPISFYKKLFFDQSESIDDNNWPDATIDMYNKIKIIVLDNNIHSNIIEKYKNIYQMKTNKINQLVEVDVTKNLAKPNWW